MVKENIHLLLIDPDHRFYSAFKEQKKASYVFDYAGSYERGLELIRKEQYDAVLMEVLFPHKNLDYSYKEILPKAVKWAKGRFPVFVASHEDRPDTLDKITKAGASLLLPKSEYDIEKWDEEIRRGIRRFHAPTPLFLTPPPTDGVDGFIAHSRAMQEIKTHLQGLVRFPHVSILVEGESGVGKEIAVKFLHECKGDPKLPFVAINIAEFNEQTLESELFGHVKGAFTDAHTDKTGLFESADAGTLFLDEIGEISTQLQVKLLRVLEERKFKKMGSNTLIDLKAQLVFATNVDLTKAMQEGRFRPDFYERISGERIFIPPLRERREEIMPLIEHLVPQLFNHDSHPFYGKKIRDCFSPAALQILLNFDWPTNIRQLKNLLQKLVIAVDTKGLKIVDIDLIPQQFKFPVFNNTGSTPIEENPESTTPAVPQPDQDWPKKKKEFYTELKEIDQAIKDAGGRKADAAKALGYKNDQNIRSRVLACKEKYPELLETFPALKNAYKKHF